MPRRRTGKKIDFTHWTGFTSNQSVPAGTQAQLLFAAQHLSETLLRLRGSLCTTVNGLFAGSNLGVNMGIGIILVPEGTGTTVTWSPITDADAPWIWVEYFNVGYEEYVTDVIDNPGFTIYRSVIDNKAMRIIRNQEVQVVYENVTIQGALTTTNVVQGRALFGT